MLSSLQTVFRFLTRRQRVLFALIVAGRMLIGVLDVAGIVMIGFVASVVATGLFTGSARPITIIGIAVPRFDSTGVLVLVAVVLGVFVVKGVLAISLTRVQTSFVARLESSAATRIAEHILGGSLGELRHYSKAEAQFTVTGSASFAFTGLLNNVATFFSETCLLVLILVTLFIVNPVVAIFALLYLSVFVVTVQLIINRSLKHAGRESVEGTIETMAHISDVVDAFREIAVTGKQAYFVDEVGRSRRRISRSDATITFLAQLPRYVVETALILGVLLLVGQQVLWGGSSGGFATVGVFLAGGVRVMASLLPLQSAISNVRQNAAQAASAITVLREAQRDRPSHVGASSDSETRLAASIGVDLKDVRYSYVEVGARDAIDGVDLLIEPGTYVALIGPSGAGKTTLVDLILGLIPARSGMVRLDGVAPEILRAQHPGMIGYVPQKPGLVSGSIAENIALGVPTAEIDRERVLEVVSAAFLTDYVDSLPAGIDTSVGKQSDDLSGGQIQRLGIARALYPRPRLLVMDEATSALDASSEFVISETLRMLRGEVTVVVVAHRLSTVQRADAVYLVEGGKITGSGTFQQLSKLNPTVAEYVRLMSFDDELKRDEVA